MNLELKHSVRSHFAYQSLLNKLVDKVKEEIPKFEDLKLNTEFTLLICNITEMAVKKKDHLSKKKLVVDILVHLFDLSEEEQKITEEQVQFLWDNGRIKKISWYRFFRGVGKNYVKKNILGTV